MLLLPEDLDNSFCLDSEPWTSAFSRANSKSFLSKAEQKSHLRHWYLLFSVRGSSSCLLDPPREVSSVPASVPGDSEPLFPHTHPNHQAWSQCGAVGEAWKCFLLCSWGWIFCLFQREWLHSLVLRTVVRTASFMSFFFLLDLKKAR